MKKYTLFFSLFLWVSVGLTAQPLTVKSNAQKVLTSFCPEAMKHTGPQALVLPANPSKMSRKRIPIIDQPEGTLYDNMLVSYGGYQRNWLYGLMDVSTDGGMGKIVEGTDGNIYIYNLPTGVNAETWVLAERAEGDTVVIRRQQIDRREGNGLTYDYYITRVVWEYTDEAKGEGQFVEAKDETDMKLLYHDGVLESCEENVDPFQEGHYALGAVYTTDGKTFTWEGATNWNLRYEVLTDKPLALPEGAVAETMTVSFTSNGTESADQTKVAFVGNDVYVNLFAEDTYVRGTIEGDKLRFKSGQYLGSYYGMYQLFFVAERPVTVTDEQTGEEVQTVELLDELVFDYNAADRSFQTADMMVINAGRTSTRLYLQALTAPRFYFYDEKPATPADPKITDYRATYGDYGYNALMFTLSPTDVDGNYIVPEKLSWRAFIDDEPFIFTPDDYVGLTEEMEEVPYGFTDSNFDIYTGWYTFFFQPSKNVGMQAIYRGAGEERRSNVVYYDIQTSQVYTEADPETGIGEVNDEGARVKDDVVFDLTGRKVGRDARGLLIKAERREDGTVRYKKVIVK
ncbi:MAG: hypothetical protein IJV08_03325 [Bacteroidaceae bacterium]|nr:hypothetical protein [Bacteroidaceae bacterium]